MTLEFDPESPCVWTKGLTRIDCPVRHGEGRFVVEDESVLDRMDEAHQLTVRYVDPASPKGEGRTDASSLTRFRRTDRRATSRVYATPPAWCSA